MEKNTLAHDTLTKREIEIMAYFADNMTLKDIANKIHRSAKTVAGHLDNARTKLGFKKRISLIPYYYQFFHKCCEDCKNGSYT